MSKTDPSRYAFLPSRTALRSFAFNIGLISAGSLVYVWGLKTLIMPQHFLTGGISGIAVLIVYIFQKPDLGVVYFLLNIPLVLLGWFFISRRFILYSIYGMVFFSIIAMLIHPPPLSISDPILGALLAGVICGAGSGLILRSVGSAGGLDILAIFLNKKFGFRLGIFSIIANSGILSAGAFFLDLEKALYSIVLVYTAGHVMDAVLTGFNRKKSLMVISDQAQIIADAILGRKGGRVTFLNGEGAFSRKPKKVIFTIIALTELPKIKELILQKDPEAFIVVNNTLEVLGKDLGRMRIY